MGYHPCEKNGSVEENGKLYCRIHAPSAVAQRRAKADERFEAKKEANRKQWDEAAEQRRRAELFNELVAALEQWQQYIDRTFPPCENGFQMPLQNDTRAILAKAKQEPNR
jgi:hypothetical protein